MSGQNETPPALGGPRAHEGIAANSSLPRPGEISLADAALWYAEHSIKVFPVRERGKEPLTKNGFHDATCDLEAIVEWWKQWPNANIGVPCKANGLLVLDVDPRNGAPADSWELVEHLGPWPATAEVQTGGGGRHIYFRHPGGRFPAQIGEGIDLKADGYVLAPPSIHPSGAPYMWDGADGARALLTVADAPAWLTRDQRTDRPTQAPAGDATEPIREGGRNNALASIAGAMRARGLSAAAIEAALQIENRARCTPPLSESEVAQIAASIGRYPAGGTHSEAFHAPRVTVDTSAARTSREAIAILNSMPFWKGRIRWAEFRQSGDLVTGITEDGLEVRFDADRLLTFEHARQRIARGTRLVIQSPRRGQITEAWGAAVELILRAAADNLVDAGNAEDDLLVDLQRNYELSGRLNLSREDAAHLLGQLKALRRDPHSPIPPSAAFLVAHEAWVFLPAFQLWLGTPPGGNRYRTLSALRQECGQLGFRPRQMDLRADEDRVQVTVWCGPADLLKGGAS